MTTTTYCPDEVNAPPLSRARIAIIDHTAALSGGEIALLNFVSRLDRAKFDPVVILFAKGPLCERLSEEGIEPRVFLLDPSINNFRKDSLGVKVLLRIPRMIAAFAFVFRLAKFLRNEKVALVHTNSLKSDILGGLAGRLVRIPVIWHIRDRIESDYLPRNTVRVFRLLARIIPRHVIANSGSTLTTLGLPKKRKNFTVYSGIAMHPLLRVVHDGTSLAINHEDNPQTPQVAPMIGLVGRITPWKGQHIFIQAAAQVLKQFPKARFQIIGAALFNENEYDLQIRQMVESLGISQSIQFLGFRADVLDLISNLHLLVHSSISGEPFGQVIVEAMAAGKPVVATNGGGVPEIVVDGETGILVPMGDATAMADAIRRLLANPGKMKEMGLAGLRRAESYFSIDQTVRKIEQIYQALCSNRAKRL